MPELPDVELFRKYLDSTSLHKTIEEVDVRSEQVVGDRQPEELTTVLPGRQFYSSLRQGKHLLVELKKSNYLLEFHFGMTGFFNYLTTQEKLTGHPRVVFTFVDGTRLVYDCQRKLGEVSLFENFDGFLSVKNLGPDALNQVDRSKFERIFTNSRAMAKSTLMKQEKIAGIGNIYSDEILFQTGIHPRVKASTLAKEERDRLFKKMKEVLNTAIESEVEPEKMPPDYLLPHRSPGSSCPKCGEDIEKTKVSGRSAYFCPRCQKAPK